jgi:hypothetical protein
MDHRRAIPRNRASHRGGAGEGRSRRRDGGRCALRFARARGKAVLCFAHVTNQMGQTGDFEKGEANGAVASLGLIDAVGGALLGKQPS